MNETERRQHITQGERVIAYTKVKGIVTEALLVERHSLDLRREALDRRAQNVAASIIDELVPEGD